MSNGISRRQLLAGTIMALPAVALAGSAKESAPAKGTALNARFAELERRHGGRLGVSVLNLATGRQAGHRADERFLMCSTFKVLAAAFILARVDQKKEQLDRRITIARDDLLEWAPVSRKSVGGEGLTVAQMCDAAVTWSDNTAANLLLDSFGGPKALTAFMRGLGDQVTRMDRMEPELNAHDGADDQRDTTSPSAMLATLRRLLFGDVLSAPSRSQLAAWMITNKTGDKRLRAGFPSDWLVGDKTGSTGDRTGYSNDIGVAWPPARGAVLVTTYCQMPGTEGATRDAVIAEVARIVGDV